MESIYLGGGVPCNPFLNSTEFSWCFFQAFLHPKAIYTSFLHSTEYFRFQKLYLQALRTGVVGRGVAQGLEGKEAADNLSVTRQQRKIL